MAVSISLLAACADSVEKPADNKTRHERVICAGNKNRVRGRFYDNEKHDWYYTIFSGKVEPWHDDYEKDKNADSITTIEFPETLTRIEAGTFCGFKNVCKRRVWQPSSL